MNANDPGGIDAEILRALAREGMPRTASALKKVLPKALKLDAQSLAARLDDLAAEGRLRRLVKGKQTLYGTESLDALMQRAILHAVEGSPRTWAALKEAGPLKEVAKLAAAKDLDAIRKALIAEGRIWEWPPGDKGRTARFSTRPPDADAFLNAAVLKKMLKPLEDLAAKLKSVAVEDLLRAALDRLEESAGPRRAAVTVPAEIILAQLDALDPAAATGAPVSLGDLRRRLAGKIPAKAAFDEAIRALAEAGTVALHRYDYPAGLSERERADLIDDGRGGYYLAVSRRA